MVSILFVLLTTIAPCLCAQSQGIRTLAVVEGTVQDSKDQAIAGVAVSLERTDSRRTLVKITDFQGHFKFEAVPAGTYALRAKLEGFEEGKEGPFAIRPQQTKSVVLLLTKTQPSAPAKNVSTAIEYSDEPQFTVAGVTDTTALGGHGSDRVARNRDALSKDAASLLREESKRPDAVSHPVVSTSTPAEATEAALRASLAKEETADVHFQLAEIEEKQGRPLEAVKDYQRAAEMQSTETHLFAWAAELLLHRAFEPASEVFTKGRRLYPQSVRMTLGLGAAKYAQGLKEEAGKIFIEASDLDPADPTPYLFLGRLLALEPDLPSGWADKMKGFVSIHPESAMAHYLYAVALARQGGGQASSDAAESQLKIAIALDPHFGNAYLELGILRSQRKDFSGAIAAFQKAIETTPLPDEAHYRLADVYRRTGDAEKAGRETELFKQISEKKKMQAERQRHEMQQFVYTLRGQSAPLKAPLPDPH
jgi:tetratricopeptide (TPR) repeat protein